MSYLQQQDALTVSLSVWLNFRVIVYEISA